MKDDTPALFISKEGALAAGRKLAQRKKLADAEVYAHHRSVRDSKGWTATIVLDNRHGKHNARYVTNDDVARLH